MPRFSSRLAAAQATHSMAALAEVLTPQLIEQVLADTGRAGKRKRKLPPGLVVWLVVGMALFRDLQIKNVLRRVVDGLTGAVWWGLKELPHATSLAKARDRLGWETIRELFRRLADVLRTKHEAATTWLGLPVFTLDGTCFLTPDTPSNDRAFGRAGASRGSARSGYPQLRGLFLIGAWTHLIAAAVLGPYRKGELTLAHELAPQLPVGSLLLMDRAFYSYAWLVELLDRGVHFAVRARTNGRCLQPQFTKRFSRHDGLATLVVPRCTKTKNRALPDEITVRVLTYTVKGFRPITVVTDLLDPERYPAKAIAELYHDRWEAELSYREIKTHQVGQRVAFRSHTGQRVLQEAYGLLLAYNCVRALMAEAAGQVGEQPRRLSFVDCLDRIRAALPLLAAASPAERGRLLAALLDGLALCLLPARRAGRQCPRAVKIKMSNYARKRPA